MTTTPLRLAVISAGLSVPSSTRLLADRLTDAVRRAAGDRPIQVDVIELRELATDLTRQLLNQMPTPSVEAAQDVLRAADAVVVATPIYSGSYAGLFKLFIDLLEPDLLRGTPVLLGATAGTARHSLALDHALRPLFAHLGALVMPTGVFAATDDFASPDLGARIERAGAELVGHLIARTPAAGGSPDPSPSTRSVPQHPLTPFEQLLAGRS